MNRPPCAGDVLRDLSVADVLELTVSEAAAVPRRPRGAARLQPIVDVGLDYVPGPAGAHAVGGEGAAPEAGRPSWVRRLAAPGVGRRRKGTLFLFDEPTTGLHFDDIAKLMRALRKLLDAGHSLLVIEHNLDVIRASDWLVDLGPEGGDAGGRWSAPARRRT